MEKQESVIYLEDVKRLAKMYLKDLMDSKVLEEQRSYETQQLLSLLGMMGMPRKALDASFLIDFILGKYDDQLSLSVSLHGNIPSTMPNEGMQRK